MNVIVVGGGIIGSAIAQQVARTGAKVRVLEAAAEPGTAGATRTTWAWINANKKHPRHYRDLNLAGLHQWKAQWPSLVEPCGSLVFEDDDPAAGADPAYPAARLTPEQVREAEPAVAESWASRGALLFAQEAWVDPRVACGAMLGDAAAHGAAVELGRVVERLVVAEGGEQRPRVTGVVTADGMQYAADVVVLAAGTAIPRLVAQAGADVPLLHKPAVIALTRPLPPVTARDGRQHPGGGRLLRHMLSADGVFVWQRPDLTVMLGDTRSVDDDSWAWGQEVLARARELVPALAGAELASVEAAARPWPQDGHPIIGAPAAAAGLYVAVMHSGVTLAPEVGRLVALELAAGWEAARGGPAGGAAGDATRPDLAAAAAALAPYRPDRDYGAGAGTAVYGWK